MLIDSLCLLLARGAGHKALLWCLKLWSDHYGRFHIMPHQGSLPIWRWWPAERTRGIHTTEGWLFFWIFPIHMCGETASVQRYELCTKMGKQLVESNGNIDVGVKLEASPQGHCTFRSPGSSGLAAGRSALLLKWLMGQHKAISNTSKKKRVLDASTLCVSWTKDSITVRISIWGTCRALHV